jgi:GGDEF domain-containing protein
MIITRLNGNIDEYNDNRSEPIELSMSFGTSFYNPEHSVSIEEVLSRADDTMHETKKRKKG